MAQQYNSCCATNIIGIPTSTYPLRWQYQSKSHTCSLYVEMRLSSHNPLLVVDPSNNRGLVDNATPLYVISNPSPLRGIDQNYRTCRNMPLPVLSDIQLFVYHVVGFW